MDKSSHSDFTMDEQRRAWDVWNAAAREGRISDTSARQAQEVDRLVAALNRTDLSIIDVGCGTGWMAERLSRYGQVTGTDLAEEVLARARLRAPQVRFVAGDLFELDLPLQSFDVVITLEVLPHVKDQPAFMRRLAALLKPGGLLILATQNKPVLERWSAVGGPQPGQLRHWVDAHELRRLLEPEFQDVRIVSLTPVGDQGLLRIVNSTKLNALVGMVVPPAWIKRAKEKAMLGHTLLASARRGPAR
ncbi:MAG TPA: methyltransferase domain-containing protein [Albitalea sp.]|uniref:class I SAM-dependent methyltransferase n=1 Tax=Piscinibacter sp. TaxID=1903157 RepID=UPI002ED4A524